MSIWLAIPSARPAAEAAACLKAWQERGYLVAIWRDGNALSSGWRSAEDPEGADYVLRGNYPGYAIAVNSLAKWIVENDASAEWIVTGGDDTFPDPNRDAFQIGAECTDHFGGTFGVMQPTGDRFASGSIDRIAGSPWLGREWCQRANAGQGPLWPEFAHMFVDEALMRVAQKLGIFWQRRDLIHMHRHFMRASEDINSHAVAKECPPHLVQWNSPQHWNEMKAIFQRLEAEDFASCMPVAA